MGRAPRAAEGGLIYHAMNRANGRASLFRSDADYQSFLDILGQAVERDNMRLLAYCIMPNHWHLLLWPVADGDLSRFMRWLTLTHTQRRHAHRGSTGGGHLYQGRYKSFPIQSDDHFLTACRYVERNALRANLVPRAEDWLWGSLHQWRGGADATGPSLTPWPIKRPTDWLERVNRAVSPAEEESFRRCLTRGQPLGDPQWQAQVAGRLGLGSTLRPRGRPPKSPDSSPKGT